MMSPLMEVMKRQHRSVLFVQVTYDYPQIVHVRLNTPMRMQMTLIISSGNRSYLYAHRVLQAVATYNSLHTNKPLLFRF